MRPAKAFLVLACAVALLFAGPFAPVQAATITVNTTDDELNSDGDCSLREAIQAANTDAAVDACAAGSGDDAITLPAGTYTLALAGAGEDSNATGDLDISSNLTITGAAAATTIIDGGAIDRVLQVNSGTVTLNSITIQNGDVAGSGGGIENKGTLTLVASIVTNNTASINAGGIFNNLGKTLTLTNSTVSDNTSTFDGAGIFNQGGTVNLTGSTVSGNTGRNGGGIKSDNNATLTITESTISGNTAEFGAGINNDATLNLIRSTISGNTTTVGGGGGIFTNFGTLTLTNSTISGNPAGSSGGGGIYSSQATVTMTNMTVANNTHATSGGGLRADTDATYTFKNTIIADSPAGGDCFGLGTFTSLGHNLDSDNSCNLTDPNDLPGANPLLGTLQDNGGPTFTHALQAGSPAIGAGDDAAAPATDQIGTNRPQGVASDIGAFEVVVVVVTAIPAVSPVLLVALALVIGALLVWGQRRRAAWSPSRG